MIMKNNYLRCTLITRSNKRPPNTSLYDNSARALIEQLRDGSVSQVKRKKMMEARNGRGRTKHAVDIEEQRRAWQLKEVRRIVTEWEQGSLLEVMRRIKGDGKRNARIATCLRSPPMFEHFLVIVCCIVVVVVCHVLSLFICCRH